MPDGIVQIVGPNRQCRTLSLPVRVVGSVSGSSRPDCSSTCFAGALLPTWWCGARPCTKRVCDKCLDEVFVKIGGVRKYLWRAVDQHADALDILIQGKRDGYVAARFVRKILKQQGCRPWVLITAPDWGASATACGRIQVRTG